MSKIPLTWCWQLVLHPPFSGLFQSSHSPLLLQLCEQLVGVVLVFYSTLSKLELVLLKRVNSRVVLLKLMLPSRAHCVSHSGGSCSCVSWAACVSCPQSWAPSGNQCPLFCCVSFQHAIYLVSKLAIRENSLSNLILHFLQTSDN